MCQNGNRVVFLGVSALQFWASGGVWAAACRAFNRRENAAGSGKRHNADRPKNRQRQIILGMKPEMLAKFVRKKRNMMRRAIRQKYGSRASRRGVRKSKAERRMLLMSFIPRYSMFNITGTDNSSTKEL